MALTYSAQVKTTKDDTSSTQTFNNLYSQIDDDESIYSFGTAYAALFDSDTSLVSATSIRKRTIAASND